MTERLRGLVEQIKDLPRNILQDKTPSPQRRINLLPESIEENLRAGIENLTMDIEQLRGLSKAGSIGAEHISGVIKNKEEKLAAVQAELDNIKERREQTEKETTEKDAEKLLPALYWLPDKTMAITADYIVDKLGANAVANALVAARANFAKEDWLLELENEIRHKQAESESLKELRDEQTAAGIREAVLSATVSNEQLHPKIVAAMLKKNGGNDLKLRIVAEAIKQKLLSAPEIKNIMAVALSARDNTALQATPRDFFQWAKKTTQYWLSNDPKIKAEMETRAKPLARTEEKIALKFLGVGLKSDEAKLKKLEKEAETSGAIGELTAASKILERSRAYVEEFQNFQRERKGAESLHGKTNGFLIDWNERMGVEIDKEYRTAQPEKIERAKIVAEQKTALAQTIMEMTRWAEKTKGQLSGPNLDRTEKNYRLIATLFTQSKTAKETYARLDNEQRFSASERGRQNFSQTITGKALDTLADDARKIVNEIDAKIKEISGKKRRIKKMYQKILDVLRQNRAELNGWIKDKPNNEQQAESSYTDYLEEVREHLKIFYENEINPQVINADLPRLEKSLNDIKAAVAERVVVLEAELETTRRELEKTPAKKRNGGAEDTQLVPRVIEKTKGLEVRIAQLKKELGYAKSCLEQLDETR